MPARIHSHVFIFIVCSLGIAMFSGMDAVMKFLVLAMGAFATMLWRNMAGLLMSAALYLPARSHWPDAKVLRIHVLRGILTAAMGFLFFWGIAYVPLAQAIALAFIAPLIALYLASVLLKERIGPRSLLGSAIAFSGVVVIFFGQTEAELGRDALIGSLAVLASAALYAVNIIMMRQQSLVAGPREIAFFQNLTATALFCAGAPFIGASLPLRMYWPWLLLAAALSIASMLLLSWAYARAEASYLATTEYTAFLWAALFGWLVFREPLALPTVCGAAFIILGCIVAARTRRAKGPPLELAS